MWKNICEATTLKGKRCKKKKNGEHFCTIHNPDYKRIEKEIEVCSICLEQPFVKWKLGCNHHFCQECIFTWICKSNNTDCPMCRKFIDDSYLKNNAINYGLNNKLLYRSFITIYKTCLLSPEEYDSVKYELFLYENQYLTRDMLLSIKSNINSDIYEKMTENSLKIERIFQLTPGMIDPPKEYFIIHSERVF
jgi:hypothetical protein